MAMSTSNISMFSCRGVLLTILKINTSGNSMFLHFIMLKIVWIMRSRANYVRQGKLCAER